MAGNPAGSEPEKSEQDGDTVANVAVPALPPAMAESKRHTVDEVVQMMNRMPLFMTELDETDGEGGENVELEALKALAYEGTRAEVAQNFREQGNDQAKLKRWLDAREFYDKALAALKSPRKEEEWEEIKDEEVELNKEKEIAEACYTNRALCNLEKKNYRSCNLDCAATLRLNERNVKAWYRSASACLALDKIPEAEDACSRGLEVEPSNKALSRLSEDIAKRKGDIARIERERQEREERKVMKERTLRIALKERGIKTKTTSNKPDLEDAEMQLMDPLDKKSTLSIPVMLMYSVHLQTDLIKSVKEHETLQEHLNYILEEPLPWDEAGEYKPDNVNCYVFAGAGLVKVGKKLSLIKILEDKRIEIEDGLLRIHVIPKSKAAEWIEEVKKRLPPRT
ncbi:TPR repeat protein-like protein [Rhizodiscina lignyota]|uniref:TPR repeat protein-like protein n=1 Tax=Rhizodiscina lignyota TaxID=1504668 RepID=A0A9P4IME0_9PEZI|nr:TPR repeat protein-like protein [Rhizodiscina lignyota]